MWWIVFGCVLAGLIVLGAVSRGSSIGRGSASTDSAVNRAQIEQQGRGQQFGGPGAPLG